VRIALGAPLISMHGPSSPVVEASYRTALALAERLDDASRRFPALWGLWYVQFTRGSYEAALEAGQRLLDLAGRGDDGGQLLEAHHSLWPTLVSMGEVRRALPHLERGIALYDRERHGGIASVYAGHDPGACCRYFMAVGQWFMGYPDRARATMHEAVRLAETLGHAMTRTLALSFASALAYLCGDRRGAATTAERCLAVIDAHDFRGRRPDMAVLLRGVDPSGADVAALDALQQEHLASDIRTWRKAMGKCIVVSLYAEAGAPGRGLELLAEMGDAESYGVYGSEVHRVEGELRRLAAPGALAEAERCFERALDLARRRELRSLELRAATSLARLWRDAGRAEDARSLLAPVHGWFTEGFDTHDLRAAGTLLDELGRGR